MKLHYLNILMKFIIKLIITTFKQKKEFFYRFLMKKNI